MVITKNIRMDVADDDTGTKISCQQQQSNSSLNALIVLGDNVTSFAMNKLQLSFCDIAALRTSSNASSIRSLSITSCAFHDFNVTGASVTDPLLLWISSSALEEVFISRTVFEGSTYSGESLVIDPRGVVHISRTFAANSSSNATSLLPFVEIDISDSNAVATDLHGAVALLMIDISPQVRSRVSIRRCLLGGLRSGMSIISFFRGDGSPLNATTPPSLMPPGQFLIDNVQMMNNFVSMDNTAFALAGLVVLFVSGDNEIVLQHSTISDVLLSVGDVAVLMVFSQSKIDALGVAAVALQAAVLRDDTQYDDAVLGNVDRLALSITNTTLHGVTCVGCYSALGLVVGLRVASANVSIGGSRFEHCAASVAELPYPPAGGALSVRRSLRQLPSFGLAACRDTADVEPGALVMRVVDTLFRNNSAPSGGHVAYVAPCPVQTDDSTLSFSNVQFVNGNASARGRFGFVFVFVAFVRSFVVRSFCVCRDGGAVCKKLFESPIHQ